MPQWISVCDQKSFKETVRTINYQGNTIAVFRTQNGFYAIDDACSHADASLSEGELHNFEIECPRHGARFDIRTGKNLSFPAVTPVKSYPTKIENGIVYVQVG